MQTIEYFKPLEVSQSSATATCGCDVARKLVASNAGLLDLVTSW